MKIFTLVLFSFFFASPVFSQQNFFVYVQTDNKQPFYIKLNNKVYSSSSTGYAIISKLQKGDYSFSIGFPKNEFPLQNILLTVNEDAGYLLKNFGDKGWGLFNMQTLAVLMAGNKKAEVAPAVVAETAKTADNPVSVPVPQKPLPVASKEEVAKTTPPAVNIPVKTDVATASPSGSLPTISRLSFKEGPLGRTYAYIDKSETPADTISLFLAVNEQIAATPVTNSKPSVTKQEKFLDIEMQNPNSPVDTAKKNIVAGSEPAVPSKVSSKTDVAVRPLTINSDCKSLASDDDFLKMRKKMAAETSEDGMISAAKKLFKVKCYTTEQVKNLSLLFLKDSGKYNFFDSAYPFINDTQNFGTLEGQLSDPYYVTRFKAMLRN